MKTPPMKMPDHMLKLTKTVKVEMSIPVATEYGHRISFAQCETCKQIWQVAAKGRLPKCPNCGDRVIRVPHLETESKESQEKKL